jgi:hypothetical protein
MLWVCNVKTYAPEDDIVDVETCKVNKQPKWFVIDGMW